MLEITHRMTVTTPVCNGYTDPTGGFPMRLHSCFAVLVAVAVAASPVVAQRAARNMTGEWLINLDPDFGGRPDTISCTFKQENLELTGSCKNDGAPSAAPLVGEVKDLAVTFQFPRIIKGTATATVTGVLNEDASTLQAEWHYVEDGKDHRGKFSGNRRK